MDGYISREAVLNLIEHNDKVCHYADERYENVVYATTQAVCKVVAEMPAADVQPVKRGKWIDCTFYDPYEKSYEQSFVFKCSNCGHKIYKKPNDDNCFCGHCEAKMDGGAE